MLNTVTMNDNAPKDVAKVQEEQAHLNEDLINVVGLTEAQAHRVIEVGCLCY